jgi:hypothetical protein
MMDVNINNSSSSISKFKKSISPKVRNRKSPESKKILSKKCHSPKKDTTKKKKNV